MRGIKRYNRCKDGAYPGRSQKTEVDFVNRRCGKRLFVLLLCFSLCLGTAGAAEDQELGRQRGQAMRLEDLGLFLGVGDSYGTTDFALWRSPSRAEAVTMLVRALGREDEAAAMGKTHPFTDVPAWADGYVSYAWENDLTKGVSDTAFGAWDDATGEMYVTFMLRALGYADGTDFTWEDPWTLAEACGILPEGVDRGCFNRGDAVEVTAAALFAKIKGTDTTLADQLIAQGAFSREDFDRAFRTYEEAMAELAADDFYLEKERWESDCGTVLLGNAAGTPHPEGWSLRLVTKPASALGEGLIIQLPIVRTGTFSTAQPDQVSLSEDGRTFTYSFYFDHADVEGKGTPEEYVFHEAGTYTYTADLSTGVAVEEFQPPEGPPLTPEEEQQAYDDAIHEMMENGYGKVVLKRWEGEVCTALLTQNTGIFHAGLSISLDLVGKPGSPLGAGERVHLPLPHAAPEEYAQPADLAFSADGQSLTYSCAVQIDVPGPDGVTIIQEKGTYNYTVDLITGEVTEAFLPLTEGSGG